MKNNNGFSLIEILISIAVAAVILPGVIALQSLSSFTSGQSETYTKAYSIAQEEMESIYNLKTSWDWDNPLYTPSFTYGFDKTINIEDVDRCGYQICPEGTPGIHDKFTKKVSVIISWKERGKDQQIELISYVAKI